MRVTKTLVSRITATALFALVLLPLTATTADAAAPKARSLNNDALRQRTTREIDAWAAWLKANKATGFVGEVGWPSDDPRWNTLADSWFKRVDAAGIGVTSWVAGEWVGNHQMAQYAPAVTGTGAVATARPNALIAESHFATSTTLRGVNISGPEMGAPAAEATSSFSNTNIGSLVNNYHYDAASTYQYLAGRGVRTVRLPFRWERVQRSLFGPLDTDEMARLAGAVHAARDAGLKVVLDLHNYGAYYLSDPATGRGVRRALGSAELPITAFTDVWTKLANYFAGDDAVHAFGLMNEPANMAARGKVSAARVWEQASQQAVNVIRATGDTRTIMVPGYDWSGLATWARNHPTGWINDSARNFQYEAHQYFDQRHTGIYRSYDQELAAVAG